MGQLFVTRKNETENLTKFDPPRVAELRFVGIMVS